MDIGIVVCRMNPPHIGHYNLVKKIDETKNFDKLILLTSATEDSEKNPLPFEKKIKYIAASLSSIDIEVYPKPMTNIYGAVKNIAFECQNSGGGTITLYCGSDRTEGYKQMLSTLLPKYQLRGELLDVDLQVEEMSSRGDEGTYSATEMRDLVKRNKFEDFKAHCSPDLSDDSCLSMFMDLKRGMKLTEATRAQVQEFESSIEDLNAGFLGYVIDKHKGETEDKFIKNFVKELRELFEDEGRESSFNEEHAEKSAKFVYFNRNKKLKDIVLLERLYRNRFNDFEEVSKVSKLANKNKPLDNLEKIIKSINSGDNKCFRLAYTTEELLTEDLTKFSNSGKIKTKLDSSKVLPCLRAPSKAVFDCIDKTPISFEGPVFFIKKEGEILNVRNEDLEKLNKFFDKENLKLSKANSKALIKTHVSGVKIFKINKNKPLSGIDIPKDFQDAFNSKIFEYCCLTTNGGEDFEAEIMRKLYKLFSDNFDKMHNAESLPEDILALMHSGNLIETETAGELVLKEQDIRSFESLNEYLKIENNEIIVENDFFENRAQIEKGNRIKSIAKNTEMPYSVSIDNERIIVIHCGFKDSRVNIDWNEIMSSNKASYEKLFKDRVITDKRNKEKKIEDYKPYQIADILLVNSKKTSDGFEYLPISLKKDNNTLIQLGIANLKERDLSFLFNLEIPSEVVKDVEILKAFIGNCIKGKQENNSFTPDKIKSVIDDIKNKNQLDNIFNKNTFEKLIYAGKRYGFLKKTAGKEITKNSYYDKNIIERIVFNDIKFTIASTVSIKIILNADDKDFEVFIGSDKAGYTGKYKLNTLHESVLFNNILRTS